MEVQDDLMIGFFSGIMLMACLHGLLLAGIFLFYERLDTKSNKYLALSILGICVILGYEFVFWLDVEHQIPVLIQYLPLYIRTTIPVGIYFFAVYLVQPEHQLSNFEKLSFVAIGLEVLLELTYFPAGLLIEDPERLEVMEYGLIAIGWLMSVFIALLFLPRALQMVNRYQKFLFDNYSTTSNKSLSWLRTFLLLVLFLVLLSIISFVQYILQYWEACEVTFTFVTIGLVLLLFWIGYAVILKYNWFEIVPFKEETKELPSNKLSTKTETYHQNLLSLIQEEKLFEDTELTLDRLSERMQLSSGYLSQIINEKEGKNFFEFINAYRVEAVKEKLLDEDYHHYTIMGVAIESGFKSKSTFNAVFKKSTGHTPSTFKKIHS